MPRESSLWSWLSRARRAADPSDPLVLLRMESPTVPGLPDVYAAQGSRTAWIELKVVALSRSGRIAPRFEPFQLPAQELFLRAGVPALVLVQAGRRRYLLPGGARFDPAGYDLEDAEALALVDPGTRDPYRFVEAALAFAPT